MNPEEFEQRNIIFRWTPTAEERAQCPSIYPHHTEYAIVTNSEDKELLVPYIFDAADGEWFHSSGANPFLWKLAQMQKGVQ